MIGEERVVVFLATIPSQYRSFTPRLDSLSWNYKDQFFTVQLAWRI